MALAQERGRIGEVVDEQVRGDEIERGVVERHRRGVALADLDVAIAVDLDLAACMACARLSLAGLSVGDALGERFFGHDSVVERASAERAEPPAPWSWTDDTAMALPIVETLERHGDIDPDFLARRFARRYELGPHRGYGGTAREILQDIASGQPWRDVSAAVFGGEGSRGNGAAMRVAPVGAYVADDLPRAIEAAHRPGTRDTRAVTAGGTI